MAEATSTFSPIVFLLLGGLLVYFVLKPKLRVRRDEIVAARNEASAAHRLFRIGFERTSIGSAFLTSDGAWLHVNPKLLQMLGYSREEFTNSTLRGLTHPDDRKKEASLMADVLSGRSGGYSINKRLKRKDGTYGRFRVELVRCHDSSGTNAYQCLVDEVTEAVDGANEAFSLFDDVRDVSVIRLDAGGLITTWNRGAEDLFGFKSHEIAGKPWARLHPAEQQSSQRPTQLLTEAATGGMLIRVESRVRKDGTPVNVRATLVPQFRSKELTGFIEIARDSTLHAAAAEYRDSYERLKATTEERLRDLIASNDSLRAEIDQREKIEASLRGIVNNLRMGNRELTRKSKVMASAIRTLLEKRREARESEEAAVDASRPGELLDDEAAAPAGEPEWQQFGRDESTALLDHLSSTAATGVLSVRMANDEKRFRFDDGKVVACTSTDQRLLLGRILVESGVIDEQQQKKAVEAQRESGLSLGRTLVVLGFAAEHEVQEAMRRKIVSEVGEVLASAAISASFVPEEPVRSETVPIDVDPSVLGFEQERNESSSGAGTEGGSNSAPVAGGGVPASSAAREPGDHNGKAHAVAGATAAPLVVPSDCGLPSLLFVARKSVKSKKYHCESCPSAQKIPARVRLTFNSREEAESEGFIACRNCVADGVARRVQITEARDRY